MASTIKIKNSSTASAVPTSSDLVQGELAVNVTDKRIYTENASGTVVELGTNPSVPVTFPDGSASAPSLTSDGDTNTGVFFPAADTLGITTGGTERARFDSSGNLLVGTADSPATLLTDGFAGVAISASNWLVASRFNNPAAYFKRENSNGEAVFFLRDATTVGSVSVTTTATSFNTSSDYRLKEDIAPMTGALAKVALLKPCTYKWKLDGSDGQGFIAHELQEVVGGCVTGEKDAVDEDGNPKYQGIDTSFLVATLTAAIQEQQAVITTLTARIEALEAA